MEQQTEEKKPAKKRGHRRLLYGEKTKMVGIIIPISKEEFFWKQIADMKRQWINEAKKVS